MNNSKIYDYVNPRNDDKNNDKRIDKDIIDDELIRSMMNFINDKSYTNQKKFRSQHQHDIRNSSDRIININNNNDNDHLLYHYLDDNNYHDQHQNHQSKSNNNYNYHDHDHDNRHDHHHLNNNVYQLNNNYRIYNINNNNNNDIKDSKSNISNDVIKNYINMNNKQYIHNSIISNTFSTPYRTTISKTYNNDYNKKNYDIDISDKLTRNSFYDNENNNGDVITVIDDDIDNYQHANSKLDDNDSNETIMKITSSNIRSNLIDESMNNNSIILLSEHDDYFTTTTTTTNDFSSLINKKVKTTSPKSTHKPLSPSASVIIPASATGSTSVISQTSSVKASTPTAVIAESIALPVSFIPSSSPPSSSTPPQSSSTPPPPSSSSSTTASTIATTTTFIYDENKFPAFPVKSISTTSTIHNNFNYNDRYNDNYKGNYYNLHVCGNNSQEDMMKIDNNTAKDDNIVKILNEDNYYDNKFNSRNNRNNNMTKTYLNTLANSFKKDEYLQRIREKKRIFAQKTREKGRLSFDDLVIKVRKLRDINTELFKMIDKKFTKEKAQKYHEKSITKTFSFQSIIHLLNDEILKDARIIEDLMEKSFSSNERLNDSSID